MGCTGYAHETARIFGDELVLNVAAGRIDLADPRDLFATFLPTLTRGRQPLERARLALTAVTRGNRFGEAYITAACEVGRGAARRLPEEVQQGVYHVYELWQGGGAPAGLARDDIPVASRIARLTGIAALFDTIGGVDLAVDAVLRRGGGMLDPHMAEHFASGAEALPGDVNAGERLRFPAATITDLEVAGLLHDVGRVAISDTVWEKPGSLNAYEWGQVRLHAWLDRSGWRRSCHWSGCTASGWTAAATTAAAPPHADPRASGAGRAYQAMTQRRPHRLARPPEQAEQAEQCLLGDAHKGIFDADAVSAVLVAAGHDAVIARQELPTGLTDREVEVLRLVADGCSNARIAQHLVISRGRPSTTCSTSVPRSACPAGRGCPVRDGARLPREER